MKALKIGLYFAASAIFFINSDAFSANKKIELTGMLRVGSSESSIDSEDGNSASFSSDSVIANRIFSKCEAWENCFVSAIIDEYGGIVNLIDVKKPAKNENLKNGRKVLISGEIRVASLDSVIESNNGDSYSFITNSEVSKKIFDECKDKDMCQITAIVDENDFIIDVITEKFSDNKSVAIKPSFDCGKASSFIENAICASEELSSLDNELMKKYKMGLSVSNNSKILKTEQRDWLKNSRNKCENESCLKIAYINRINNLNEYVQYQK